MPSALRCGMRPIPITITTDEIVLGVGDKIRTSRREIEAIQQTTLRIPTWPKSEYTKDQLLDMVLETCPHPRRLYYVDLGDTHGACAIH